MFRYYKVYTFSLYFAYHFHKVYKLSLDLMYSFYKVYTFSLYFAYNFHKVYKFNLDCVYSFYKVYKLSLYFPYSFYKVYSHVQSLWCFYTDSTHCDPENTQFLLAFPLVDPENK